MRMLRWVGVAAAAGLMLVAAPAAQAANRFHVVVGFTYVPGSGHVPVALDSVKKGTTMVFVNADPVAHTVTVIGTGIDKFLSGVGTKAAFGTGGLVKGKTYKYYCTIHGQALMSGLFKVT